MANTPLSSRSTRSFVGCGKKRNSPESSSRSSKGKRRKKRKKKQTETTQSPSSVESSSPPQSFDILPICCVCSEKRCVASCSQCRKAEGKCLVCTGFVALGNKSLSEAKQALEESGTSLSGYIDPGGSVVVVRGVPHGGSPPRNFPVSPGLISDAAASPPFRERKKKKEKEKEEEEEEEEADHDNDGDKSFLSGQADAEVSKVSSLEESDDAGGAVEKAPSKIEVHSLSDLSEVTAQSATGVPNAEQANPAGVDEAGVSDENDDELPIVHLGSGLRRNRNVLRFSDSSSPRSCSSSSNSHTSPIHNSHHSHHSRHSRDSESTAEATDTDDDTLDDTLDDTEPEPSIVDESLADIDSVHSLFALGGDDVDDECFSSSTSSTLQSTHGLLPTEILHDYKQFLRTEDNDMVTAMSHVWSDLLGSFVPWETSESRLPGLPSTSSAHYTLSPSSFLPVFHFNVRPSRSSAVRRSRFRIVTEDGSRSTSLMNHPNLNVMKGEVICCTAEVVWF